MVLSIEGRPHDNAFPGHSTVWWIQESEQFFLCREVLVRNNVIIIFRDVATECCCSIAIYLGRLIGARIWQTRQLQSELRRFLIGQFAKNLESIRLIGQDVKFTVCAFSFPAL